MASPKNPKKCRRKLQRSLSTDFAYCSLFYIRKVWGGHAKPSKEGRKRLYSGDNPGYLYGHSGQSDSEQSDTEQSDAEQSDTEQSDTKQSDNEQPISELTTTRERTYYTSSEGDSDEDDQDDANNNIY
jgi:hypothetical protein